MPSRQGDAREFDAVPAEEVRGRRPVLGHEVALDGGLSLFHDLSHPQADELPFAGQDEFEDRPPRELPRLVAGHLLHAPVPPEERALGVEEVGDAG